MIQKVPSATCIRGLSLTQPWSILVVLGKKCYETRTWQTEHRGPLAIHASKTFPPAARELCRQEPFRSLLASAGFPHPDRLPLGALVGVVEVRDCQRTEELEESALTDLERALGDFGPGRWAWRLEQPRRLTQAIPLRGQLGVFNLPSDLLLPL